MDIFNNNSPDNSYNVIRANTDGYLLVEGLENWISGLVRLGFDHEGFLQVQDPMTKARFLIRKVND